MLALSACAEEPAPEDTAEAQQVDVDVPEVETTPVPVEMNNPVDENGEPLDEDAVTAEPADEGDY
ncbi:hypothetical protein BMF35_b0101 [Aurantiacibacter gangjinensis]|nr:hypothetical protein BMF35_b0101 [Aurantiacibacter gangjinensis]